jgi:hypothetical protein
MPSAENQAILREFSAKRCPDLVKCAFEKGERLCEGITFGRGLMVIRNPDQIVTLCGKRENKTQGFENSSDFQQLEGEPICIDSNNSYSVFF